MFSTRVRAYSVPFVKGGLNLYNAMVNGSQVETALRNDTYVNLLSFRVLGIALSTAAFTVGRTNPNYES